MDDRNHSITPLGSTLSSGRDISLFALLPEENELAGKFNWIPLLSRAGSRAGSVSFQLCAAGIYAIR